MAWERKPFYSVTEFSYAFAFLHEQVLDYHDDLLVAPITPNLIQEGQLAWDVLLPTKAGLFFFQFKKPEYIVRPDARCVRKTEEREEFPTPCYRITIHKKHNYSQHFLLKQWADRFPWTFYVSPQIADDETYQRFFFKHQITENSRFIPLSSCRDYEIGDPRPHYIVYGDEEALIRSCSDSAHEIKGSFLGKSIRENYRKEEHWTNINLAFIFEFYGLCCKLAKLDKDLEIIKQKLINRNKNLTQKEEQQLMLDLFIRCSRDHIIQIRFGPNSCDYKEVSSFR